MGASLALSLKQNQPGIKIFGYDQEPVLSEALKLEVIDQRIENWPDGCNDADVVFLATPLNIISQHLHDLNGIVGHETLVSDLGSTKIQISELVKKIGFSGSYIGGHPMTGAEKSGLKAANPLLYENAVYILTGVNSHNRYLVDRKLFPLLELIKARTMLLDPESHDKIMAAISHLPQLVAIALVNLVGSRNVDNLPYFELAAGGFRDLTRIASSSYDMWKEIIDSNQSNIEQVLQEFIDILGNSRLNLSSLQSPFEQANSFRAQLPKKNKGFLSPLTDILVYVTDQVGAVAKIANALSEKGIDIRDMELLKIREKEGGVFRLSFSNAEEAKVAVDVLNSIKFKALIRE
jgi:prephenate dehydrogenase